METYIWTIVVIVSFQATGKLILLAKGEMPEPRTPSGMAFDLFVRVCLAVWGIVVLIS